jgi:MraZ protein
MFLSSHESGVDAKKRVSVPASFRKGLSGEDSIFLWPSIDKPCLEGGGVALVGQFQRAIARLKPLDPRREALSYAIFGRGRHARFDDGGRIGLELDLLAHASIVDKVRFIGLGDRFQIWAPDVHQPRSDSLLRLALDSGDLLDPFSEDPGASVIK